MGSAALCLSGFAFAGLYVVIESWLNDRATTANRGAVMSAYTFISLCVLMAGQFLLTTYDPAGVRAVRAHRHPDRHRAGAGLPDQGARAAPTRDHRPRHRRVSGGSRLWVSLAA